MKNIKSNVLILIILFSGFLILAGSFFLSFYHFFKEDVRTISELSSENIYSHINNLIDAPLNVSITMSKDIFLQDFVESNEADKEKIDYLTNYLDSYHKEYSFDAVFFASAKTYRYYDYQKGFDYTLERENPRDAWFFDVIEGNRDYTLNVDKNDAYGNKNMVFINCKLKDEAGKVLGVVGVGMESDDFQKFLKNAEDQYGVSAYLIQQDGAIMISSKNTEEDHLNLFDTAKFEDIAQELKDNYNLGNYGLWYSSPMADAYMITQYLPNLNWYLVVEKDTNAFLRQMRNQFIFIGIFSLFIILLIIFIVFSINKKFNREILNTSQRDSLTQIRNRGAYNQELLYREKELNKYESFALGVVDLNDLKTTNDHYGHLSGDILIKDLAITLCNIFKDCPVFRIGGDEFVLIFINKDAAEIEAGWEKTRAAFGDYNNGHKIPLSAAFGYAFWDAKNNTMDKVFKAADDAMYAHKLKIKAEQK